MSAQHTPGLCPGCGTQMVNCGAPIWEDYCPNEDCTHQRDEMFAGLREQKQASDREKVLRNAAPELLEALELMIADFGDYPASERPCLAFDRARAAIAKARGEA